MAQCRDGRKAGRVADAAAQPAAWLAAKGYLAWRVRRTTGADPTVPGSQRLLRRV